MEADNLALATNRDFLNTKSPYRAASPFSRLPALFQRQTRI